MSADQHDTRITDSTGTDMLSAGTSSDVWPATCGSPPFHPAVGIRGGHRQTIIGTLLTGADSLTDTVQRRIRVSDDDYVVLHDDQPDTWKRGDSVVLMLHGLSGGYDSGYMMRIAARLHERGVRAFRMDHRGCGASQGLATHPYHAGRIDDLHRAVAAVEALCPESRISVVGFSLSGNLVLRYLGDRSFAHSDRLFRAVAVCPPVDLRHCVRRLDLTRAGQRYDWYFTRRLISQIAGGPQWRDDVPLAKVKRLPRRLYDFDDMYTAPASGFGTADNYYQFASAGPYIGNIELPTTILASEDDPLVCPQPLLDVTLPARLNLCLTRHGGHLGYVGRRSSDRDRRWMDWRVIEWLLD